jgi:hypothetical protein
MDLQTIQERQCLLNTVSGLKQVVQSTSANSVLHREIKEVWESQFASCLFVRLRATVITKGGAQSESQLPDKTSRH